MTGKFLTVADLTVRWQCNKKSVLQAIHIPGGLKAINIGNSRQPRWRIREDDLLQYERSRENHADHKVRPLRRTA